ncbi:uncharacterized protein A4U43_C07F25850 [Asparagus officinalis]|uniref:Uncharacterized protein n=1 Tax=Asparagus officinalis TaxID=4686 RepID=A0A5P1EK52_ASPOF|nr:uncharacterized protein A4U43_C07F25850 [Asparagus officinalis]
MVSRIDDMIYVPKWFMHCSTSDLQILDGLKFKQFQNSLAICIPNCVLEFEGRLAIIHALEPIAKGKESPCEELKEDALLEGSRCKDGKCGGFLLQDSGTSSTMLS